MIGKAKISSLRHQALMLRMPIYGTVWTKLASIIAITDFMLETA
ncbi:hypothetical protein V7152_19215 [Neobacillus drentensis]